MKIRILKYNKKVKKFDAEFAEANEENGIKKGQYFQLDPFCNFKIDVFIVNTSTYMRSLYNYFRISVMSMPELEHMKMVLGETDLDKKYLVPLQEMVMQREHALNRDEAMAVQSDYSFESGGVDTL